MFMNRSDRSVTSKIDLELKRLRGEQSDPYPQLNGLRELVYGIKAVPWDGRCGSRQEEDEEEGDEEEGDGSAATVNWETQSPVNSLGDDVDTCRGKGRRRRRSKRTEAVGSSIQRLLCIGQEMETEPCAAWQGPAVYRELQTLATLFGEVQAEQQVLLDYVKAVEADIQLLRQLLDRH